jgi:hypothetical protein
MIPPVVASERGLAQTAHACMDGVVGPVYGSYKTIS